MRLIDSLRRRLRSLLHRDTSNIELNDELRFHLEALIERNIAQGMSPKQARAAAHAEFGEPRGSQLSQPTKIQRHCAA